MQPDKGIVLGSLRFGDHDAIARIYTRRQGVCTFMCKGIHGRRSQITPSMLQPITLLDMVYRHRENQNMQYAKELRANPPLLQLQGNMSKTAIALFCAEVLQKTMVHAQCDEQLFDDLWGQAISLNNCDIVSPYWPHLFLIRLARNLGLEPSGLPQGGLLHLSMGGFMETKNLVAEPSTSYDSLALHQLIQGQEPDPLPKPMRIALLGKILSYLSYHLDDFKELKSLPVLHHVFQ
jgi:DNA repair protein RecO (recombination protein O)